VEGQGFRDRAPELEAAGAEILGISFDPPEANLSFAERNDFPYRFLSDLDRSIGEAYGTKRPEGHDAASWPRRFTYLIDPEGRVAKAYVVRDVTIHPAEVLADLESLRG